MKPSGSGRPHGLLETSDAVYCARCHVFALAIVDHQPLCRDCIAKRVLNKDIDWISAHLSPVPIPVRGSVLARDRRDRGAGGKESSVA